MCSVCVCVCVRVCVSVEYAGHVCFDAVAQQPSLWSAVGDFWSSDSMPKFFEPFLHQPSICIINLQLLFTQLDFASLTVVC